MKKILGIVLCLAVVLGCFVTFIACDSGDGYEIAIVTDVGQLMDGGFNQGTYEGAKAYAEANHKSYKYYQPANGSDATDVDRVAAMNQAITNGAKVIVAPGFLQAGAMTTVAIAHPEVKFIFVDGWPLSDKDNKALANVTAVVYKEQESGYMAGYAAVKEGYTKLGGTFGGGGTNPACNRFALGYINGANDAAEAMGLADDAIQMKLSFKYGNTFSASDELNAQISGWYKNGTEVVFSCGGSMLQSVKAASEAYENAKIIGVDTDQASESEKVITSAVKGLSASVQLILTKFYDGKWDSDLSGKASNLGAAEDATGLPTGSSFRFSTFTAAEYTTLFNSIKNGTIVPESVVPTDANDEAWIEAYEFTKIALTLEK